MRRRRLGHLARIGTYGAVVIVVVAGTVAAVGARGGDVNEPAPLSATIDAPAPARSVAERGEDTPPPRASSPVVPVGRTALPGGVYAERSGDTVTVHFDTRDARTRRSDKFETVVRETLPLILGEPGRRALAQVVPGTLVAPGQLVAAVGGTPLRLPVGDGRVVTVAPGTRMGQDGPLVVTYRAVVDVAHVAPTS